MDLALTPDQEELRGSVRGWLERHCTMDAVRDVVEGRADAGATWGAMAELGWPALTVPEEHGGLGLGAVELALIVEELGRAVAPGPFLATVGAFVPALRRGAGRAPQLLAAVAGDGLTGTVAFDASVSGRAEGDATVLTGEARWVIDGASADEVVVPTDVGLFVVPGDDVGARPVTSLDPTRRLAHVRFDRVTVASDRRIGDVDGLEAVRQEALVAIAADIVGACQAAFDMTLQHVQVREQFGVPIGSFQAVKHALADCFVALQKARAAVHVAALTVAEDDPRRTVSVAMAKAAAGDCQRLVTAQAIQLHGGIGYTWEHDLHLVVKRAQAGELLLGGAREQRATIADHILA